MVCHNLYDKTQLGENAKFILRKIEVVNLSDHQIQVLQKALQVTFEATAPESAPTESRAPVSSPEVEERLSSALVQFLSEETHAPTAEAIIEILSTIATAL